MLIISNLITLFVFFGIIFPYLISIPQTEAVILGIFLILIFIPSFIIINYKQIKNLQK